MMILSNVSMIIQFFTFSSANLHKISGICKYRFQISYMVGMLTQSYFPYILGHKKSDDLLRRPLRIFNRY